MVKELTKKETYSKIENDFISHGGLTKEVFSKEVSFAIQHFNANPYLKDCDVNSSLKAVLNVAQTGLSLNPVLKYAYLVPRSVRRGGNYVKEVCLEPSYIGLAKLLTDSGSVTSINTQIIWENDEIEINIGSDEKVLKHIPSFLKGEKKGKVLGAYSLATLPDGTKHIEIMDYESICEIKERSESYKSFKNGKAKSSIWVSDEPEMIRKTVIKRHSKYLPKTNQFDKVSKAIDLDNQINGFLASDSKLSYIDSLVHSAEITSDEKQQIENSLMSLTDMDADKIINFLNERQPKELNEQFKDILDDPSK